MKRSPKILGEILVVDDNQDTLQLLSQLFEGSEYRSCMASNGQQAIWMAVSYQPDLILLDVRMPGMSGLDVCRSLKQYPATASIPVIILSAADTPEDRIAGFEAGAADFIGKPFVDADVLARVKTHIDMSLIRKDILWQKKLGWDMRVQARKPMPNRKEILIVDDSPDSLQLLSEILKSAGFIVRAAPNGELALWSAKKHPPDMVLLDIRMPGMNGIDVCLCLKMDPATTHIPVIFISALCDMDTKEDGFVAGAVDYITKPFVENEVLARVSAHLRLMDETYHANPDAVAVAGAMPPATRGDIEEAFSYSATAIMFLDAQGKVSYVNPSFVRLTGYMQDEMALIDLHKMFGFDILSSAYLPAGCCCRIGDGAVVIKDNRSVSCGIFRTVLVDAHGDTVHIVALEVPTALSSQPTVIDSPALLEFASFSVSHAGLPNLETSLYGAVGRGEMNLLYQPIFHTTTRRLIGAEALLRWEHPRFGTLVPSQFLVAAEETGEIMPIGAWVITSVCKQLKAWLGLPLPSDFRIAVNIGTLQFWQDQLIGNIEQALATNGLMAESLELDITVDTLREDIPQGIAILHRLKDIGVMLALDRYGHGSLPPEVLSRLPLDTLKIDPMPILSMTGDPASQEVVRNMVDQAHALRVRVLANGIEQQWHLALVQSCFCDQAQGYLLGAPLSASQFLAEHLHVR